MRASRAMAAGVMWVIATTTVVLAQPAPDGQPSAPPDSKPRTDDLAKRLIRGESTDGDVMSRLIDRMKEVENRLVRSFDPGTETRGMQQRILDDLDAVIAASIRRGTGGGGEGGLPTGDMRRREQVSTAGQTGPGRRGDGGTEQTAAGAPEPVRIDSTGPLRESRRGWGHLPPRDRDEVLQGIDEPSLESFQEWINRYYKTLADEEPK